MRYSLVKLIAIAATSILSSGVANAAVITNTYTVVGSNFSSTTASPFASITESFTISFDNSVNVSQQTSGISLNASTITPSSTLGFTYIAGIDTLIVGGLASTVATADPNSTDFALTITNASNPPNFSITALSYTVGTGTIFTATRNTVGTPPIATVPEPATLGLLATAAAVFGFVRRRRAS